MTVDEQQFVDNGESEDARSMSKHVSENMYSNHFTPFLLEQNFWPPNDDKLNRRGMSKNIILSSVPLALICDTGNG
jgi:hypothetical protein